jgi:hypothetical protein
MAVIAGWNRPGCQGECSAAFAQIVSALLAKHCAKAALGANLRRVQGRSRGDGAELAQFV